MLRLAAAVPACWAWLTVLMVKVARMRP